VFPEEKRRPHFTKIKGEERSLPLQTTEPNTPSSRRAVRNPVLIALLVERLWMKLPGRSG
jgi:hypothetical protein